MVDLFSFQLFDGRFLLYYQLPVIRGICYSGAFKDCLCACGVLACLPVCVRVCASVVNNLLDVILKKA